MKAMLAEISSRALAKALKPENIRLGFATIYIYIYIYIYLQLILQPWIQNLVQVQHMRKLED